PRRSTRIGCRRARGRLVRQRPHGGSARMRSAPIAGWGMAVPERVVTNADLAASVPGIDEEWIVRRSGIRERRYAAPDESTSTLAVSAGRRALERAELRASDIDLVVVATCTPDYQIPATAPLVQAALRATKAR